KLLRGRDLTDAEGWLNERGTDLSQDEVAFVRASAAYRVSFVVRMIALVLLVVSSAGITSWVLTHQAPQPPDPTRVTNLRDNGPGSLRQAIDVAKPGETITFDAHLRGSILLESDLDILGSLNVRGPGADILSISSEGIDNITGGAYTIR